MEIERRNESKTKLAQFYDKLEEFRNDFDRLCTELGKLVNDNFEKELFERVVCSLLSQILQQEQLLNPDLMDQLTTALSKSSVFEKLIYHLWWPLMRSSCFSFPVEDASAWRNVLINMRRWAHLLPQDFLILFIGNQILIPRFHSLLKCEDELFINNDEVVCGSVFKGGKDEIILYVWELIKNDLKLEAANILLVPEIVSWFQERIMRVSCGSAFDELAKIFVERWQKGKLLP